MKGSYVLIINLKKEKEIEIGRLGRILFNKGYYAYVGSGLNNLEKRVGRHLRKNKKKKWHIDYLLEEGKI
ncbi:MAG: GIY-YIG nuclease family protein, partial [Thermoplasmata archaeon]